MEKQPVGPKLDPLTFIKFMGALEYLFWLWGRLSGKDVPLRGKENGPNKLAKELEYNQVGLSDLAPNAPMEICCRHTWIHLNTSWKQGCASIFDPFGCSSIHQHPRLWAIKRTMRVRAHSTFPIHTLSNASSPRGLASVRRAVPEFLGKMQQACNRGERYQGPKCSPKPLSLNIFYIWFCYRIIFTKIS